jgi:hypothetical protein
LARAAELFNPGDPACAILVGPKKAERKPLPYFFPVDIISSDEFF